MILHTIKVIKVKTRQESTTAGCQLPVCQLYMCHNKQVGTNLGEKTLHSEVQVEQCGTCPCPEWGLGQAVGDIYRGD